MGKGEKDCSEITIDWLINIISKAGGNLAGLLFPSRPHYEIKLIGLYFKKTAIIILYDTSVKSIKIRLGLAWKRNYCM